MDAHAAKVGPCALCGGTGGIRCTVCGGTGRPASDYSNAVYCPACQGRGDAICPAWATDWQRAQAGLPLLTQHHHPPVKTEQPS